MKTSSVLWCILALLALVTVGRAQSTLWIAIEAGQVDRPVGPVFVALPADMAGMDYFRVVDGGNRQSFHAQRWNADSAVFLLNRPLPARQRRTYGLSGLAERPPGGPTLTMDGGAIEARVRERPVLRYQIEEASPPPGEPEYYRRGGFIHPLYSPGGRALTDDFPAGHRHQHALFMAWVNTTFQGEFVDFWNQQSLKGTVEHLRVVDTATGPAFARFVVEHAHRSWAHGIVLHEQWTVTVYDSGDPYIIDLRSEQRCAGEAPLLINQYHYGGFAFRGHAQWNPDDSLAFRASWQVLTSEGKDAAEANHTRPEWVAAFGEIDEAPAGVAIFSHPANFRHPQPVRVHPTMPYFCFAPMVEGAFTIAPGERFVSNYRITTYDGEANEALLRGMNAGYE
jgi:hypothetical protein